MSDWNEIAQIAPGGTILEMAELQTGQKLMVSPTGLLMQNEDDWRLLMQGIPFWRTNCAAIAGKTVFSAGLPTSIIRSFDGGEKWVNTFIDQQTEPIMKIVVSPSYSKDRILLAATDGDGILRSTDGGRHWQLSNFGLRDFHIIDLVAAPVWNDRYEYLLAASETAVYQSPNGGRAWRKGEFDEEIRPSAIETSPNFLNDQTAYLGTEDGDIFITDDAGRTWKKAASGFELINSLCILNNTLFVSGFEKISACSLPNLEKPKVVFSSELPILGVQLFSGELYAMQIDDVLQSKDQGASWHPVNPYHARRFVWVKKSQQSIVVAGPEDGVWLSKDYGVNWSLAWADGIVLDVDLNESTILISSDVGLFVSDDLGDTWQQGASFDDQIMGVLIDGASKWYGGQFGSMRLVDGLELIESNAPFAGSQLLDFQKVGGIPTTAVYEANSGELQLWQWQSASSDWNLVFSERAQPNKPVMHIDTLWGLVVGVAGNLYLKAQTGWRWIKVSSSDAPITAVYSEEDHFIVAATDKIFRLSKQDPSQSEELAWNNDPILALDDRQIVTINGRVYNKA